MIPKRAIYIAIGLLALVFFISEYTKDKNPFPSVPPVTDSEILQTYPALFESIALRDDSAVVSYTDHRNSAVQNMAWKAIASTLVESEDMDALIDRVFKSENNLAWFALSRHELSEEQLGRLENYWKESVEQRSGITRVLGRQGNEGSLDFLLQHFDEAVDTSYEYDFALAVSRLMRSSAISEEAQLIVLRRAFAVEEPELTRAYLYGYYRGRDQELSPALADSMYQHWKSYGLGNSEMTDQYVAGIIPQRTLYEIALYYNSEQEIDNNIQLAVELSQALDEIKFDRRTRLVASILLHHVNPHVVQQALINLNGDIIKGNNLYRFITEELIPNPQTAPFVWVYALESVAETDTSLIEEYATRLNVIAKENPYLLPKILEIRQVKDNPDEFLNRLSAIFERGQPLSVSYVVTALDSYWESLSEEEKNKKRIEQARAMVFNALELGDRGVTFRTQNILRDEQLFRPSDFSRINDALADFRLPEDIEVYQAFGEIYKQRFEDRAQPVIDSLAAMKYAPLNRSLFEAGWEVEVPEEVSAKFRTPDWELFRKLGRNPVWVLNTNKGKIKVRLDPLSAPATVSAIDSLTRAGAYNGVPFHRVVPNFVIQGGDIQRQDGLGGPEFVLPTEASEKEYIRGAAGIASAGTDTEGSQYFIMHQWKPHLNGGYTLFGYVIEGMDVVDEIVVGDSVDVAYWQ